jgi:hypothetical protein
MSFAAAHAAMGGTAPCSQHNLSGAPAPTSVEHGAAAKLPLVSAGAGRAGGLSYAGDDHRDTRERGDASEIVRFRIMARPWLGTGGFAACGHNGPCHSDNHLQAPAASVCGGGWTPSLPTLPTMR